METKQAELDGWETYLHTTTAASLLFDEIEKAHRLIWDLFLQMLDAARITLADDRTYDLSGFYIVCTINIGSDRLLRPTRLPFTTLERAVIFELHRFFRPELIGRFDEKIVSKPLSYDIQRAIGCFAISAELERFKERGFNLTVSEAAFEFRIRGGIQKTLGARSMKRTVQKFIGDAIREALKACAPPSGTLAVSPLNIGLLFNEATPDPEFMRRFGNQDLKNALVIGLRTAITF